MRFNTNKMRKDDFMNYDAQEDVLRIIKADFAHTTMNTWNVMN